jgi:protein-S-isoprenylcysteine O-methyltransferase Ste14
MPEAVRSKVLVAVQLVLTVYLVLGGPLVPPSPALAAAEALAIGLAAWSLSVMRRKHMRIGPEPGPDARLVTHGPYRWVRHPMYSALLLLTLGLVLGRPSAIRLAAWIVLAAVLLAKISREERLLRERFPDYVDYAGRSRKLIPGLL